MKLILTLLFFTSTAMANIPNGTYQVDKVQCKSGKVLKLGGKFMVYNIKLAIASGRWEMTAIAKSGSWAPFKLNCTQINKGKFTYTQENKLEGDLPNSSVKCNSPAWTSILKRRLFGVEEYGEFTYKVKGKKLTLFNPSTVTKYSCDKAGDYPIYYYSKL